MSKLFAYLSYRDVDAAITWLEALGFEPTTRRGGEGSVTVHVELRLGDAAVMVAPADEPYETPELIGRSTGRGLYLLDDNVAALHGAALRAGGSSVFAPEETEWGTERARVLDPEGYEWSFGTYEPGGRWVSLFFGRPRRKPSKAVESHGRRGWRS